MTIVNEKKLTNEIENADREAENEKSIQAKFGWNRADYDIRNTIDGESTIYHGKHIYSRSSGIESKYVRAFIFEGMVSGPKGDDIASMIQKACSSFLVWDHATVSIRKIDRPDGLANYRIELLHANLFRLRQFAQILKAANSVERVFEDIPQKENVLA